ncbi:hypothetical protein GJAV_G00095010 [Gymnothorax javanicus]|nr:hypothetical protein GJAV_G00095010 [Gymnothorax javanicus]
MARQDNGKPRSSVRKQQRKTAENMHLEVASSEDDDDEAPEEVTFEDSKAVAIRSMRAAIDTARREKELLKERRRKRQELFQAQKARKLLPDDILEEIDCFIPKKPRVSEVQGEVEEAEFQETEGSDTDEDEEKRQKEGKKNKKKRRKRPSWRGNCCVMRLKDQSLSSQQQQSALDFIHSRLYGPGANRTTVNELLSQQNKRALNKSSAIQFVDKQWGAVKKEKAEKFKKRWKKKLGVELC